MRARGAAPGRAPPAQPSHLRARRLRLPHKYSEFLIKTYDCVNSAAWPLLWKSHFAAPPRPWGLARCGLRGLRGPRTAPLGAGRPAPQARAVRGARRSAEPAMPSPPTAQATGFGDRQGWTGSRSRQADSGARGKSEEDCAVERVRPEFRSQLPHSGHFQFFLYETGTVQREITNCPPPPAPGTR